MYISRDNYISPGRHTGLPFGVDPHTFYEKEIRSLKKNVPRDSSSPKTIILLLFLFLFAAGERRNFRIGIFFFLFLGRILIYNVESLLRLFFEGHYLGHYWSFDSFIRVRFGKLMVRDF